MGQAVHAILPESLSSAVRRFRQSQLDTPKQFVRTGKKEKIEFQLSSFLKPTIPSR
jgi:hypothetical protein